MGLISRFGNWLDRMLEPKATFAQMSDLALATDKDIKTLQNRLVAIESLEQTLFIRAEKETEAVLKLRDEMNAIRALLKIQSGKTINDVSPRPSQRFDGSEPWKR